MRRILSCITSLLIITAAVSRRVSLRTLSAECKEQHRGRGQRDDMLSRISSGLGSTLDGYKHLQKYIFMRYLSSILIS